MRKKPFYRHVAWILLFVFVCTMVTGAGGGLPRLAAAEEASGSLGGSSERFSTDASSNVGGSPSVSASDDLASGVASSEGALEETGSGGQAGTSGSEAGAAPPEVVAGGGEDSTGQSLLPAGDAGTGSAVSGSEPSDTGAPEQPGQSAQTDLQQGDVQTNEQVNSQVGEEQALMAAVKGPDTWPLDKQGGNYTVYFYTYDPASGQQAVTVSGSASLQLVDAASSSVVLSGESRTLTGAGSFVSELAPAEGAALAAGQYLLQVVLNGVALRPVTWYGSNEPALLTVKGEEAVLPSAAVSGSVYWHAEQAKGYYYGWLSSPVSGELYMALADAENHVVAASEKLRLDNSAWFYGNIYPLSLPLPTGDYSLQVVLDGKPLDEVKWWSSDQDGGAAVVKVVDGPFINYLYSAGRERRQPAPDDKKVYVEISAYGVTAPEELNVRVVRAGDGDADEDLTGSSAGCIKGRDADGTLQLLYEIELKEPLSDSGSYRVRIEKDGEPVQLAASVQDGLSLSTAPAIYRVEAADPAVGKLALMMVNVPAGTLDVSLKKWQQSGDNPWDGSFEEVSRLGGVFYDGSGVLNVQFMDEGRPLYIGEGVYQVCLPGIVDGYNCGTVSVGYADEYCADRCSAAAVLEIEPVDVLALKPEPQQAAVEALLANINPGTEDGSGRPVLELVQLGSSGRVEKVVAAAESVALEPGYDPKGYRFNNLYKLSGTVSIPANLSNEWEYRWRVTCKNQQGEERTFLYSKPVVPRLGPYVKKVTVENGLEQLGEEHHQMEMAGESSAPVYLISTRESEIEFSLEGLFMIDDLASLNAVLKKSGTGDVVGVLRAGSLAKVAKDRITGKLDITDALSETAEYVLSVTYGSGASAGEAGSAVVRASGEAGVMSLSLYENNVGTLFAAGDSFEVKLLNTLNLSPGALQVELRPVGGEEGVPLDVAAEEQGRDITLTCTAEGRHLEGWHELRISYNGAPLKMLSYNYWDGELESYDLAPQAVFFTPLSFVSGCRETREVFQFKGGGIDSGREYVLVLRSGDIYRSGISGVQEVSLGLSVADSSTLVLNKSAIPEGFPRGECSAYVMEGGTVLPVTQELTLLLAEGEKPVVQPVVAINNGARFTTSLSVTVNINPGTYTLFKAAESEEGLAGVSYQNVVSVLNYTFTSEGYGTKKLYLKFMDEDGNETGVIVASIEYIAGSTAAPESYGIKSTALPVQDAVVLNEGERVTFWLKTDIANAAAGVMLYSNPEATGTEAASYTLMRGAKDAQGCYVYSRTVSIDKGTYSAIKGLVFYLRDLAAQKAWQSEPQAVAFAEAGFINSVKTVFQRAYFVNAIEPYVRRGSPIEMKLEGTPGRTAAAAVSYLDASGAEKTAQSVTLQETGTPGIYKGTGSVPDDAVEIKKVVYTLSNEAGISASKEESYSLKVAAAARFILNNGNGAFDGLTLTLNGAGSASLVWNGHSQTVPNGQSEIKFSSVLPGSYAYMLSGSSRVYDSGELSLGPGEEKTVDLTAVGGPAVAVIEAKTNGEKAADVNGYISYSITDRAGKAVARYGWARIENGEARVSGLQVGDTVRYSVMLDWNNLERYRQPDGEYTFSVENQSCAVPLQLSELETVSITGRVIDSTLTGEGEAVPLEGAVAGIVQGLDNGNRYVYNNSSVTVGEDGTFTVKAYKGASATLLIQKAGYASLTVEIPAPDRDIDIGDKALDCLNKNYINVRMLLAPAVRQGDETQYLPAAGRIEDVKVFKGGVPVKGNYSPYNGRFTIEPGQDLRENDTVTVKAYRSSYWWGNDFEFEGSGEVEAKLSRHLTAEVEFKGRSLGYISAQPVSVQGASTTCHMLVFDNSGNRIGLVSGTGTLDTSRTGLRSGEYTVVFLSGDNLNRVNNLLKLQTLDDLGLTAGVHYIKLSAEVSYGLITDLGRVEVPVARDEDLGYLAMDGTSITARQLEVDANGSILAEVTVRYRLADRAVKGGVGVSYLPIYLSSNSVDGSGEAKIKNRECYFNGQKFAASSDSSINLSSVQISGVSGQQQGIISFTVELKDLASLDVSAYALITRQAPYLYVNEGIGKIRFDFSAVTIVAPEEVVAGMSVPVQVRGVAPKGSEVSVLDNGLTVGMARADERGRWQASINLTDPSRPGIHVLQSKAAVNGEQVVSRAAYTRVLRSSSPVVDDITIWQPYYKDLPQYGNRFEIKLGTADDAKRAALSIYPYAPVFGKFKLVRMEKGQTFDVPEEEVDYACFVNDYYGTTTLFPAKYNKSSGYWEAEMRLQRPGELSVVYSLKVLDGSGEPREDFDVSYLTGSSPIDVSALPDRPLVDPSSLPDEVRNAGVAVTADGKDNPDAISATLTIQGSAGGTATLTFSGTHERVEVNIADLEAQGFIRIDTAQGYYYTKAPEIRFGSVEMRNTVYFSPELYSAFGSGAAGAGVRASDVPPPTSTTQAILDKADYVSYLSGEVDLIVSTSPNPNALGSVGTGMTVFGGAVLAGQVALGRVGKDPASLSSLVDQVEDSNARSRLMREIDEYAKATSESKYVNVLMGGVSYGASFFGPLGKGLSFVVSTGGQVYGKKIGDVYDTWYDAILRMILVELEKQNRKKKDGEEKKKGGKKKKLFDPVWKIDPSGYVFEATESQRVSGVKATALVKDGDSFRDWSEAADWDEVNPQITNAEGKYGWDVPEGVWKVRFEGEGYQTYETKEVEVPPAHDQVNIGLLATAQPQVKSVEVYPDGVEVEFDRYMLPSSLEGNITILDADGYTVPVKEMVLLDAVDNTGYTGTGPYSDIKIESEKFARRVLLVPDTPGSSLPVKDVESGQALQYQVNVSASVSSYAGVAMGSDYEARLEAGSRKVLMSVEQLSPIRVPKGTAFESLGLPQEVSVTLDDESVQQVPVEWLEGSYNRLQPGEYEVEGLLTLPPGVSNPDGIRAAARVVVGEPETAPELASLLLSGQMPASFYPGDTFDLHNLTLVGKDGSGRDYGLNASQVSWVAGDNSVVSISGWTMTANAPGSTTIKAVVGGIESNSLAVTVSSRPGGGAGGGTSGGGGGGGAAVPQVPETKPGAAVALTKDDVRRQAAAGAKAVVVEIPASAGTRAVELDREAVQAVVEASLPLLVKTATAQVEIPAASLVIPESGGTLQLKLQPLAAEDYASILTPTAGLKAAGQVVELSLEMVSGESRQAVGAFAAPVVVRLAYNPSGVREDRLGAYRYDETGKRWLYQRSRVDTAARMVEFAVSHFSRYAVMEYSKTFADIQGHWAQSAIEAVASRWVIRGVDDTHFRPDASVTRAEFAVMLVQAMGIETGHDSAQVFSDVRPDQWFFGGITAAYRAGLVQGYGDGRFAPGDNLTREQLFTLIVNALRKEGRLEQLSEERVAEVLSRFADVGSISNWARESAAAAVENGLVRGRTAKTINPQERCTRAESAVLIRQLMDIVNKLQQRF